MNLEALGPIAGLIIGILAIIYGIMAFLVPIFIYYIQVYIKKLLDEQHRANQMFEACLKRILEEGIKSNRNMTALINALSQS